jgi:hypothetical protein
MEVKPVGGGMYVMDGKSYDLSTLILAISLERADAIEKQIIDQMNQMKKRNEEINALSIGLAEMRGVGEKDKFDPEKCDTKLPKPGGGTYNLRELMEKEGIAVKDSKQEEYNGLASGLKALQDDMANGMTSYPWGIDTGVPKPDGKGTYRLPELMSKLGMREPGYAFDPIGQYHYTTEGRQQAIPEIVAKMGSLKAESNQWDNNKRQEAIEKVKARMDSLNGDSQMDMIRMQSLVNKRDQAYEMATNLMSKDQKSKDAIISNLR